MNEVSMDMELKIIDTVLDKVMKDKEEYQKTLYYIRDHICAEWPRIPTRITEKLVKLDDVAIEVSNVIWSLDDLKRELFNVGSVALKEIENEQRADNALPYRQMGRRQESVNRTV